MLLWSQSVQLWATTWAMIFFFLIWEIVSIRSCWISSCLQWAHRYTDNYHCDTEERRDLANADRRFFESSVCQRCSCSSWFTSTVIKCSRTAAVVPTTFHGHVELFPPSSAKCPLTTPHPSNILTKAFQSGGADRWLLKLQLQAPNKPHYHELLQFPSSSE